MRKIVYGMLLAVMATLAAFAAQAAERKAQSSSAQTVKATGLAARIEQAAYAMIPEEKMNRAMGFFGPVTKKYKPVFDRFQREYQSAEKKLPIIVRYVPEVENAVAEAKAMKVPVKYEAEKAEYIKMADAFVMMLKMTLVLSSATNPQ